MEKITRPALRYYGGKWNLAPWIISHFPKHRNYVEPCGGAASVLLQKPRSDLETYNDLDKNVVNFFKILRDRPDELVEKIRLTPWARAEYEPLVNYNITGDELERARQFFVMCWQAIGGQPSGWRHITTVEEAKRKVDDLAISTSDLYKVANRLLGIQIECSLYSEIIQKYDGLTTLTYFDPPYLKDTRTASGQYLFEWSDAQHVESAQLLRQCVGYVVVSGYACPLYQEIYEAHGWVRYDKKATTSGENRIESIWLSPRTAEVVNKPKQVAMW